jgi:hypothetical protein
MTLPDWIDKYPQVKALMQQDGEQLSYDTKEPEKIDIDGQEVDEVWRAGQLLTLFGPFATRDGQKIMTAPGIATVLGEKYTIQTAANGHITLLKMHE